MYRYVWSGARACIKEIIGFFNFLFLQVTKNRLNGMTDYSGIPLWYDIPSKRILEARGMNHERFGWNIEDGFLQVPDMGEEVEIEFW